jgi:hypothetical protein
MARCRCTPSIPESHGAQSRHQAPGAGQPRGRVHHGVLAAALDGGAGSARPGRDSGRYFDETRPSRAMGQAYDAAARHRLRDASLALVAPFRRR